MNSTIKMFVLLCLILCLRPNPKAFAVACGESKKVDLELDINTANNRLTNASQIINNITTAQRNLANVTAQLSYFLQDTAHTFTLARSSYALLYNAITLNVVGMIPDLAEIYFHSQNASNDPQIEKAIQTNTLLKAFEALTKSIHDEIEYSIKNYEKTVEELKEISTEQSVISHELHLRFQELQELVNDQFQEYQESLASFKKK